MKIRRSLALTASISLSGFVAIAACGGSGADGAPGQVNGGNGGTGGTGLGSGTGSVGTGSGGTVLGTGGTAATGGVPDLCEDQSEPAILTPVNIVFIVDKSGSMGIQDINGDGIIDEDANEWDHAAERWDPVSAALIAFFQNPGAEGLAASLEFFPTGGQPTGPETGVCSTSQYASPSVPLKSLDDPTESALLVTRVESTTPSGGTPTLPAVTGAHQYAARLMEENPGSQSVVVLVTDGMPGVGDTASGTLLSEKCFCFREPGCPDEDEIPLVAQVASNAVATLGIPTYVIGMGEVEPGPLDMVAAAGGTERAFIVTLGDPADTQAQFTAALSNVRSVQAPCNIQIPAPPEGETFDKLKVNVEFVPSSGVAVPLYYAGALAAELGGTQLTCPTPPTANPWFWTYDNEAAPTQIILCPSACGQTEGDANGRVNVAYGCTTEVPEIR